jgi:NTP pyrophosphatase (non-canonical NTP hydrolase)
MRDPGPNDEISLAYKNIHDERIAAHRKHHDKPGGSMEMHTWDDPDWLPVLTEELGEVAKEICDHRHGKFDRNEYKSRLRAELVQVAAMAVAWIEACDEGVR